MGRREASLQLDVRLLGPLELRVDGASLNLGKGGQQVVLANLALGAGNVVTIDTLVRELWGDQAPPTARTMVYGHVARLRRMLARAVGEPLGTQHPGYVLSVTEERLDLSRFRRALATGMRASAHGDWGAAAGALSLAEAEWRGPVCDGLAFLGDAAITIQEIEAERVQATRLRLDARLRLGEHLAVIPELERLAFGDPLDEEIHGRWALALYQTGRQADAQDVLRTIRRSLREELGVDPRPELMDLDDAIRRQDPDLRIDGPVEVLRRSHHRWISAVRIHVAVPRGMGASAGSVGPVLTALERTVLRAGGDALSLPGEGVLAIWGMREAEVDVATRATRAAISAVQLQACEPLQISAAVATGAVTLREAEGADSLRDAAPTFDAATLIRSAAAGEVLIDRTTRALLPPAANIRSRGDVLVLDALPPERAAPVVVGRDRELRSLADEWRTGPERGKGRLVAVTGPPGIGKTELATAFIAGLDGARHAVLRCERAPFEPAMLTLAKALSDVAHDAGLQEPPSESLHDEMPLLSVEQLFLEIRRRVVGLAAEGPFVVLIDDLQWAGDALVSSLARLVHSLPRLPVLLLLTSREHLSEDWQLTPSLTLDLPALDRAASIELLGARAVSPLPAEVVEQILLVAGGNPLFLGQSAAFGSDVLETHAEGSSEEVAEAPMAIPSSTDLVLHARLQRLPRLDRLVLECLAVLDAMPDVGLLASVVPSHVRDTLDDVVPSLRASGWLAPEGLRFGHELIREAAYAGMTAGARASRHGRAAAVLEERLAQHPELDLQIGTHLEALATALREAGEAGSAEEGRAVERGSELLAEAGRRMLFRGEADTGCRILARASDLRGIVDAVGGDLAVAYVQGLVDAGQLETARTYLETYTPSILALGDPAVSAYLAAVAASLNLWSGKGAHIEPELERSIGILQDQDHVFGVMFATRVLAWSHYHRGSLTSADEMMEIVDSCRRRIGLPGSIVIPAGLIEGSVPLDEDALARAVEITSQLQGGQHAERLAQVSGLLALRGDEAAAREAALNALTIAEELHQPVTTGAVSMDVGLAAIWLGDPDMAVRCLRRSERTLEAAGEENFRSTALALLARALAVRGDARGALDALARGALLGLDLDLLTQIVSAAVKGRALTMLGEASGLEVLRGAVDLAGTTELAVQLNDARVDLAHGHRAMGQAKEAASAAQEAIEGFTRKGALGAVASIRSAFADVLA